MELREIQVWVNSQLSDTLRSTNPVWQMPIPADSVQSRASAVQEESSLT